MEALIKCRIISNYNKLSNDELNLKIGDIVDVINKESYIWYGKFKDERGFFPSKIAEIIEEKSLKDTQDTKNIESPETFPFNAIISAPPLEDKRRSRARSTGRPPSQLFIKETILRCNSLDDMSSPSEEEIMMEDTTEKPNTSKLDSNDPTKMLSVPQVGLKIKSKLESVIQKEINVNNISEQSTNNKPDWMKALPRKKLSVPSFNAKSEKIDSIPPWVKEIRKKKEHKLSLRDDELISNLSTENQVFKEEKGTSEIHQSSSVDMQKRNVQTKFHSVSTESTNSSITNFEVTLTKTSGNIDSLIKQDAKKFSQSISTPATCKQKEDVSKTDVTSESETQSSIENRSDSETLVKISQETVSHCDVMQNEVVTRQKLSFTKEENQNTIDRSDVTVEKHKEKISISIQHLMEKFENFETQFDVNSAKMSKFIKEFENKTEEQQKEMKKAISSMKEELYEIAKNVDN